MTLYYIVPQNDSGHLPLSVWNNENRTTCITMLNLNVSVSVFRLQQTFHSKWYSQHCDNGLSLLILHYKFMRCFFYNNPKLISKACRIKRMYRRYDLISDEWQIFFVQNLHREGTREATKINSFLQHITYCLQIKIYGAKLDRIYRTKSQLFHVKWQMNNKTNVLRGVGHLLDQLLEVAKYFVWCGAIFSL